MLVPYIVAVIFFAAIAFLVAATVGRYSKMVRLTFCCVAFGLAVWGVVWHLKWRKVMRLVNAGYCIAALRQIDGAKEQWAWERKKTTGEPVNESEVARYVKIEKPWCKVGGKYTFGKVDEPPFCSVAGHTLN